MQRNIHAQAPGRSNPSAGVVEWLVGVSSYCWSLPTDLQVDVLPLSETLIELGETSREPVLAPIDWMRVAADIRTLIEPALRRPATDGAAR